jgi:hypothetical protein
MVSRGQRNGSPQPHSRFYRPVERKILYYTRICWPLSSSSRYIDEPCQADNECVRPHETRVGKAVRSWPNKNSVNCILVLVLFAWLVQSSAESLLTLFLVPFVWRQNFVIIPARRHVFLTSGQYLRFRDACGCRHLWMGPIFLEPQCVHIEYSFCGMSTSVIKLFSLVLCLAVKNSPFLQ